MSIWKTIKTWGQSMAVKVARSNALKEYGWLGYDAAAAAALGDKAIIAEVAKIGIKQTVDMKNRRFWDKILAFVKGAYTSEEEKTAMRKKLVEEGGNPENAYRLVECIDRAETTQKMQYLINATRCLLADFIDREEYFRICNAIAHNLEEDLQFLRTHILDDENSFSYSASAIALRASGLMIDLVIGGDDPQFQFIPFARKVDRFALSYGDVDRYPNPTVDLHKGNKSKGITVQGAVYS